VFVSLLADCMAYSSALKMEAVGSSEANVNLNQTKLRHILGDTILLSHRPDKL
jgi:hypothetical protein